MFETSSHHWHVNISIPWKLSPRHFQRCQNLATVKTHRTRLFLIVVQNSQSHSSQNTEATGRLSQTSRVVVLDITCDASFGTCELEIISQEPNQGSGKMIKFLRLNSRPQLPNHIECVNVCKRAKCFFGDERKSRLVKHTIKASKNAKSGSPQMKIYTLVDCSAQ